MYIAHAPLLVVLAREVWIEDRLKEATLELTDVADSRMWRDILVSGHLSLLNLLSVIYNLLEGRA